MNRKRIAHPHPWTDVEVALVLAGVCAWKDGRFSNKGEEWLDAITNLIGATSIPGFRVSVAAARRQLKDLIIARATR
jgi:hypothetical protein